ncbi:MAG: hypothetical protein KatS3mg033_0733 [Thermonema sp.]|nr:MAG: hypothetical protein KatS3mg033_0733 [Thermonema sp.]
MMHVFTQKIRSRVLLLSAGGLLLLLLAWLLSFDTAHRFLSHAGIDSQIQENVLHAFEEAQEEADRVRLTFQNNNQAALAQILDEQPYPFYVFKNGSLFFWSDFSFVPPYEHLKGAYRYRLLNLSRGLFLAYHDEFLTGGKAYIETYVLIPIYRRYPVENNYLQSGFNTAIIPVTQQEDIRINPPLTTDIVEVKAPNGQVVFSYMLMPDARISLNQAFVQRIVIGIACLGMVLLAWAIWLSRFYWIQKQLFEFFWAAFFVYLLLCRGVMTHYRWLSTLTRAELFDSKLYASSMLSPSLGDLLVNALLLTWLVFALRVHLPHTFFIHRLHKVNRIFGFVWATCLALLSYVSIGLIVYFISTLYLDATISLDISTQINFSAARIVALFVFLLFCLVYFLLTNLCVRLFCKLLRQHPLWMMLSFSTATLFIVMLSYQAHFYHPWIVFIHGVFFLLSAFTKLPNYLFQLRYRTTLYLFAGAVVCAFTGAYTLGLYSQQRILINKVRYAESLMAERDLYTEFLLKEVHEQIRKDYNIQEHLRSPFLPKQLIKQRIRRIHLNNRFDNYQVRILLFDAQGNSLDKSDAAHLDTYLHKYAKKQFQTEEPYLYFINEQQAVEYKISPNLLRAYILKVLIKHQGVPVGYVLLELKQKKDLPYNVYPELMVDSRFRMPSEVQHYSYSVWLGRRLLYSYGQYNYEKDFNSRLLNEAALYQTGIESNGFHHVAVLDRAKRTSNTPPKIVVVSSPAYKLSRSFTNFSFLLLILILFTGALFLLLSRNRLSFNRLSFTAKIQLYLNFAFFVPLLIVSAFTLSFMKNSYEEDLQRSFLQQANNAMLSLSGSLQLFDNEDLQLDALQQELAILSRYGQVDINLFSAEGNLIASSQPNIFENGLISTLINPKALVAIRDLRFKNILLEEQIGKLRYQSVYVAVKSFEDGKLLGILSIPFFEAQDEQSQKLSDLLAIIINIFTITFSVFLLLSQVASRTLTEPLQMIAQKLRKTTFQDYNEPLDWDSDDEIGLLVNEYNRMLLNLESSKKALAQSEKESAWREMAKQVAHEIKNPLTPMKLTLQQLERRMQSDNVSKEDLQRMLHRTISSLVQQIDTLSDIATSFSTFAKMPSPRLAPFDIADTLRNIIELHRSQNKTVFFLTNIAPGSFKVMGDDRLTGRILTNLILNAIQAVPDDRTPQIMVSLYRTEENMIRIEVRDNGSGIPEHIQKRIFTPSFTTKASGSGIGLAVAKRGIEQMNGRIWFETKEGEGTCFFIELPPLS